MSTMYAHYCDRSDVVTLYTADAHLVRRLKPLRHLQHGIPLHTAIQDWLDAHGMEPLAALIRGEYGVGADFVIDQRHIGFERVDGVNNITSLLREHTVTEDQLWQLHAVVTYALLLNNDFVASSPFSPL
jgi:hypothetical protein